MQTREINAGGRLVSSLSFGVFICFTAHERAVIVLIKLNTKSVIWNVSPLNTPTVIRNCNKCGGKKMYHSSNRFRINAQSRNLYVWLIYNCGNCDNTWNMAIHSGIKPESIQKEEYRAYIGNDIRLAFKCAFNKSIISQNQAVPCYDEIEYEIQGEDIDINQIAVQTEIDIRSEYELDVRISKILRQKLRVSGSEMKKLIEQSRITGENNIDLSKAKLKRGVRIFINNRYD